MLARVALPLAVMTFVACGHDAPPPPSAAVGPPPLPAPGPRNEVDATKGQGPLGVELFGRADTN